MSGAANHAKVYKDQVSDDMTDYAMTKWREYYLNPNLCIG
jgi:hypothetical protein